MGNKLLLKTPEAAATLGVSRGTIDNLVRAGALTRVKIGKASRIPVHSLETYVASLEAVVKGAS